MRAAVEDNQWGCHAANRFLKRVGKIIWNWLVNHRNVRLALRNALFSGTTNGCAGRISEWACLFA